MSRTYRLKKRAESQAETRRRIVHATVHLHGELGPARTTVSAIARLAGVQRATVYDHFPDEGALFEACTSHYYRSHPTPDPSRWRAIRDPERRLCAGLAEVYAYHEQVEPVMTNVVRDAELKPQMWETEAARALEQDWADLAAALLEGWTDAAEPSAPVAAAVRHALDFRTWRMLVREQGLSAVEAVDLMADLVRCAAARATAS